MTFIFILKPYHILINYICCLVFVRALCVHQNMQVNLLIKKVNLLIIIKLKTVIIPAISTLCFFYIPCSLLYFAELNIKLLFWFRNSLLNWTEQLWWKKHQSGVRSDLVSIWELYSQCCLLNKITTARA